MYFLSHKPDLKIWLKSYIFTCNHLNYLSYDLFDLIHLFFCVYMVLVFVSFVLYFFPFFIYFTACRIMLFNQHTIRDNLNLPPKNTHCLCMLYYLQLSCTKITHDNLIPRTRLVLFLPVLFLFFCYVLHPDLPLMSLLAYG